MSTITITADPCPTRVPLRPLQLKSSQSLCLVQDLARVELEAEKVHQEKVQQEKLKEVTARINFEEGLEENSEFKRCRNTPCPEHQMLRCDSSRSRKTEPLSESEYSGGGHWKSISKKQKSSIEEDDLSQPWVCEETDPFTPRIRYFDFLKKTRMPNNVKTYNGSDDPEDQLKIFQATAKVECWAMPTWCHIFNSTLTGSARVWFDDLPPESIDSYDDLKKAFLANFLQQKKCIKDPVEIHHIKQREGESTENFVQRFKAKSRHVKGAPECKRISGFMHEITNPELIKSLHDNIPKSVDEMMRLTTTFLRG
ncbi:reverse transcriptase domain-containing protein [Tanacetum coccineum]